MLMHLTVSKGRKPGICFTIIDKKCLRRTVLIADRHELFYDDNSPRYAEYVFIFCTYMHDRQSNNVLSVSNTRE